MGLITFFLDILVIAVLLPLIVGGVILAGYILWAALVFLFELLRSLLRYIDSH